MIPITKPFLPPKETYKKYIDGIWERDWLTNMGPLANTLEEKLGDYLGTPPPVFVTSGTLALQMAIKALDLKGEIITTPFSFIATTSSIVWEGCTPVFVDIDPDTLNIDPAKIEAAITENTSGMLVTHVYGNPCDILEIEKIARKHKIKVIYDAAHAFGVNYRESAVFNRGDISVCSLHATKLYHSGEGGLVFTRKEGLRKRIKSMRNFGFAGPEHYRELGINGKNSEFHAAMGLSNLEYIHTIIQKRKQLSEQYDKQLRHVNISTPRWRTDATKNYAYYPVRFKTEEALLRSFKALQAKEVYARRYFYPSLAGVLPYLPNQKMPVTDEVARKILCLPLYFDLSHEDIRFICDIIRTSERGEIACIP